MKTNRTIDLRRADRLGPITERRPDRYHLPDEEKKGRSVFLPLVAIITTFFLGLLAYHTLL